MKRNLIGASIILLFVLMGFVLCLWIKKQENKTRLHAAYEALNTSLIMELNSYYRDKTQYPDSLDELTEIKYSDGATPEMLKHFKYSPNGNRCILSYYSDYFEKELITPMLDGKLNYTDNDITFSPKEPEQMTSAQTFDHTSGRCIPCGDAQIYVEQKGIDGQPVLILLHGGFGSIEDFNNIAPALSRQFKLIGIDSRGHGKSSLGTAGLSYKLLTEDLALVIDSLGLQEFSIMGFSDGGIVAYRYAARQDTRLRKVVTIGASWEMSTDDPSWAMLSGMTAQIWKDMFPSSYADYMRLNPTPDFDRFAAALIAMWTDLSPDGYPGPMMSHIRSEMLIVRGDNDPLTSLESMSKLRNQGTNMSFLNIPLADHVAFDDAPEVFLLNTGRFFGVPLDGQTK